MTSPVKLMVVKHRPSNTIRMVSRGRGIGPKLSDDGLRLLSLGNTIDLFARRLAPVPGVVDPIPVPTGGLWNGLLAFIVLAAAIFAIKRR